MVKKNDAKLGLWVNAQTVVFSVATSSFPWTLFDVQFLEFGKLHFVGLQRLLIPLDQLGHSIFYIHPDLLLPHLLQPTVEAWPVGIVQRL